MFYKKKISLNKEINHFFENHLDNYYISMNLQLLALMCNIQAGSGT